MQDSKEYLNRLDQQNPNANFDQFGAVVQFFVKPKKVGDNSVNNQSASLTNNEIDKSIRNSDKEFYTDLSMMPSELDKESHVASEQTQQLEFNQKKKRFDSEKKVQEEQIGDQNKDKVEDDN